MSNDLIIYEFKRLVEFTKNKIDLLRKDKKTKEANNLNFKIRIFNNVISAVKSYPTKITLNNYKELGNVQGIGKGSIERIKDILTNGKLAELGEFKDTKNEKKNAIEELEDVVGIGRAHAIELYDKGIMSVKQLKKEIKNKTIEVNDKIKLGIKYHGVYKVDIPRKEIDNYYKLLNKLIKRVNRTLELVENKKYIFEICGSYRRGKTVSGDIDILISKKGTKLGKTKDDKHLERFVKKLKQQLKYNDGKPLLLDDMTDKNIKTKYMGFSKLKDYPVRRIDIRFIPYSSYYYALLYFTGSGDLNKKMRQIAKKKGLKLSEYGLSDKDGNILKAKSERDIFNHLGIEYLPPKLR
jgi:DNA polymerase beta